MIPTDGLKAGIYIVRLDNGEEIKQEINSEVRKTFCDSVSGRNYPEIGLWNVLLGHRDYEKNLLDLLWNILSVGRDLFFTGICTEDKDCMYW